MIRVILAAAVATAMAQSAFAQAANNSIDCDDPANAEEEVCLSLPRDNATNFVPLIAPALGAVGVGALAAAGGGGSSPSTPNTTN